MFSGKYSKAAALIKNGDIDGLREMLENGLDPEESRFGKSLLDVARKCESWDADSVLWDYKRIFGLPDDVHLAFLNIKHGRAEELKAQLIGGLPPDARDNDGRTLLVNALFEREASIVLLLLSSGVDVNARDNDGLNPPLLEAARVPSAEVISRILEQGADVNTVAGVDGGFDALTNAAEIDNTAAAKVLIDHGIDLPRFGPKALKAAASHISPGVLRLLIDNGVDVNAVHRDETALMAAARLSKAILVSNLRVHAGDWTSSDDVILDEGTESFLEIIKFLLERGANAEFTDSSGMSAEGYAKKYGLPEVASTIKSSSHFDEQQHRARLEESGLPTEVLAYLSSASEPLNIQRGRHVERVVFAPTNDIRFYSAEHSAHHLKPNRKGHFVIPAVDLVAEVNDYSEVGILSWFPNLRAFGCCDMEHQEVHVFSDVTWEELLANSCAFFNAQWLPGKDHRILPLHKACTPSKFFKVERGH